MDALERLISAARDLHALGATQVKITSEGNGPTIEASFSPPVVAAPEPEKLSDEDIARERERILLHSAC